MTLGRQISIATVFTVVSAAIVYGICFLLPKTFESEQTILFSAQSSTGSALSQILSNGNQASDSVLFGLPGSISSPNVASAPASTMAILQSRSCRQYVSDKLDLPKRWKTRPAQVLENLKRQAKVRTDENGLVAMTGQASDPKLAKEIAIAMYEYLNTSAVKLTLSFARRNKQTLEDRVKVSMEKLEKSRNAWKSALLSHPYVDSTGIQALFADVIKRQSEAKIALAAAKAKRNNFVAEIKHSLANGSDVSALQAAGGGALDRGLETLASELQKRRLELEDSKRLFTERSPDYKLAAEKSNAAKRALEKVKQDAKSGLDSRAFAPLIPLESELQGLQASVNEVQRTFDRYQKMALRVPEDVSLVKIKESQFQTDLRTAESLRFQLEQAIINEERDPARFEIVDEAVEPTEPVAPRKGLITGAWILVCAAVSFWVILRKRIRFVD